MPTWQRQRGVHPVLAHVRGVGSLSPTDEPPFLPHRRRAAHAPRRRACAAPSPTLCHLPLPPRPSPATPPRRSSLPGLARRATAGGRVSRAAAPPLPLPSISHAEPDTGPRRQPPDPARCRRPCLPPSILRLGCGSSSVAGGGPQALARGGSRSPPPPPRSSLRRRPSAEAPLARPCGRCWVAASSSAGAAAAHHGGPRAPSFPSSLLPL